MMQKNSILILVILLSVVLITGCDNSIGKKIKKIRNNNDVLKCSREGRIENGSGDFSYTVEYKDNIILNIHSVESVTMNNKEDLKPYVDAFNEIKSHYEDLDYYDINVKTKGNTVTNIINIDYRKVNVKDIIDIEGEKDNIYEDNKPMLDKWLDLAKKMGVECSEES